MALGTVATNGMGATGTMLHTENTLAHHNNSLLYQGTCTTNCDLQVIPEQMRGQQ